METMRTERIARSFTVMGIAWALLVPYGFYMMVTTHAGTGTDGLGALVLRGAVSASAFLLGRSVRRGAPFAPPSRAAMTYAVVALLGVLYGIGKAASPHSELGFLHFGGDESVGVSLTFPEMYWARYADSPGPAQGFALFVAVVFVVVHVVAAARVRSAMRPT